MTGFWFAAGALAIGALSFVFLPIWRHRRQHGHWSSSGLISGAAVIPLALTVYLAVSTWNSEVVNPTDLPLPAVDEMVATLAAKLQANPEDAMGWQMLGRSYVAIGRYPEALKAFREAWDRTPVPDTPLKLGLAEAVALTDSQALGGEARQLLEEVLLVDPGNEKALWYDGLAALQVGDTELVRQRWSALLAIGVPESMAQVMREQLAALGPGDGSVEQNGGSQPQPAVGYTIQLDISLSDELASGSISPAASLFIFARATLGGPPLAVIRSSATALPGEFVLSDANAMIPGRSLADFESLTLVARISNSGQPTETPGDLYGVLEYMPAEAGGEVVLLIDQIVP